MEIIERSIMAQPPSDLISAEAPAKATPPADLMQPPSDLVPVPSPSPGMDLTPQPKKSLKESAERVAKAGGIGAAVGAFTPEILTAGGYLAAAFPPAAPLSPFLFAGGQLARGARMAGAVGGGLSAAGGQAAGELVPEPKKVEVDIPGIQLTRKQLAEVAGEFAGPGLPKTAGIVIKGTPVLGPIVKGLEKYVGFGEDQFKKAAERELATLRGKMPATLTEPYRRIYDALARGDEQQRRLAINEFNQASQRAGAIIAHYNAQAVRVANFNVQEAERLKAQGIEMANNVLKDAAANVERRVGVLRKAEVSGVAAAERGREALASIGQPQTPTQIGTNIRNAVNPIFERLKKVRSDNAEQLKTEAFNFALEKERAGQRVEQTQAFKSAIDEINRALVNPETKLTNVSVDEVRNQLSKVKRSLDPKEVDPTTGVVTGRPVSFEALENLRRFLRDRAYGLPAEGFDAIGQQQAGRLADSVEKIQREFSPGIGKFLEQYKADSKPLSDFKTKLGQAIVGTEEFDMARFATDPATLGDKFFKSETSVKDLINLMGGNVQQVEQIARAYIADKLRTGTAKDVEKLILSSRDWIGQFPALQQQLSSVAQQMGVAERVATKRGTLAKALRTEITEIPDIARKESEKLKQQAEKESIERTKRGLRQTEKMREMGKKVAGKVEAPAAPGILGKGDPVTEIEKLISSGETEKLVQAAPAIKSDPNLRTAFNQALDLTLSRMNPARVYDDFERLIKPALLNTGMITPQKAQELSTRIRTVQMTLEPSTRAQVVRWIIKTGMAGEAGTQIIE